MLAFIGGLMEVFMRWFAKYSGVIILIALVLLILYIVRFNSKKDVAETEKEGTVT